MVVKTTMAVFAFALGRFHLPDPSGLETLETFFHIFKNKLAIYPIGVYNSIETKKEHYYKDS